MTSRLKQREPPEVRRAADSVRGFAAGLLLQDELRRLRAEIRVLDDRCAFLAHVNGEKTKVYREAAHARTKLLLEADQLITNWMKHRVDSSAASA